ncbi:MAG: PASTA domain-containing protein [Microthrixaceae bacterium]
MSKPRGLVPFLGTIVVLGCLIALFGFSGTLNPIDAVMGRGRQIASPNLLGRALPSAKAEAESLGLEPTVRHAYSLTVPRGSVMGQDPAPGDRVRVGEKIELTVSNGENRVQMPDAVGHQLDEVRGPLDDAAIEVELTKLPSEKIPQGVVLAQNPDPGVVIGGDQVAKLVVSSGPAERPVPGVAGLTLQAAAFRLGEAGLKLGEVKMVPDPKALTGAVVSTTPSEGAKVAKDTVVAVNISAGATPVAVPDVVNSNQAQAMSRLSELGFRVEIATRLLPYGGQGSGVVFEQRPAASEKLAPGESVTIVVGRLAPAPTTTTTTTTSTTPAATSPTGGSGGRGGSPGRPGE